MCDVNPRGIHVTVPKGTRIGKALPRWLDIHHGVLDRADITDHAGLAITTPARSIIDAVEDDLGARFIDQAVETARERNMLTTREGQRIELAQATTRAAQLSKILRR